ncbi:hypothetical protein GCM10023088_15950 [Actinomadura verrucosospora]
MHSVRRALLADAASTEPALRTHARKLIKGAEGVPPSSPVAGRRYDVVEGWISCGGLSVQSRRGDSAGVAGVALRHYRRHRDGRCIRVTPGIVPRPFSGRPLGR